MKEMGKLCQTRGMKNMLHFLGAIVSLTKSPDHSVPDFYLCLFVCFIFLPPEEGLPLEPCSVTLYVFAFRRRGGLDT